MREIIKKEELNRLEQVVASNKSELVFLRGRRRVGKSWLLKKFQATGPMRFFFSGREDSKSRNTLKAFAEQWDIFSADSSLGKLKPTHLNWDSIFEEILTFAKKQSTPITIILDEIQWIAKEGSGFIGSLKAAWVDWQKSDMLKVIICGSSNRFFATKVSGTEKILRGLQTRPTIWVTPFTPRQVQTECFPNWNLWEVTLAYMMLGGIPYYLERIDPSLGFIHGINNALFVCNGNLIDEVDQLLNLDFNSLGRSNARKILSSLGQTGCEQKNIVTKTGLPKGTVSRILENLVDYGIVFEKYPAHKQPTRNQEGIHYYMKDFFLNFYFQILEPLTIRISTNKSGLLFPEVLSKTGYYMPNFSGKAFELFLRNIFDNHIEFGNHLYQLLSIVDPDYQILDYWDESSQVDLIIESSKDRISRIIECKWGDWDNGWVAQLNNNTYEPPAIFEKRKYLFTSLLQEPKGWNPTKTTIKLCNLKELYA